MPTGKTRVGRGALGVSLSMIPVLVLAFMLALIGMLMLILNAADGAKSILSARSVGQKET